MRFGTLVDMADKVMMYKYIVKNVCYHNGYTATFMPKPLFGDNGSGMHTHQSLWKDGSNAVLRRQAPATPCCPTRAPLHRRPAQALPRHPGLRRADDQQLPAPGAGLRSADQPGLLRPQPLGLRPHPDISRRAPEARRLEFRIPDPVVQSRTCPSRPADGRPGRRHEQDRAPGAGRRGHLRAGAGRGGQDPVRARQPARGARRTGAGSRVPAAGRRLHPGPDRELDRLQAHAEVEPSPCARTRTSSTSTTTSRSASRSRIPGVVS